MHDPFKIGKKGRYLPGTLIINNLKIMKKYYLLLWPESQEWIGHPEAICAGYDYSEDDDLSLDQALFIPCELYDEIYGKRN
jgi:hypothetical protein